MENSKKYLEEKGYLPKISFQKTPNVKVILLSDERRTITDSTGKEIEGMAVTVMHKGEKKEIFTCSFSLIQQLAECEVNDVVEITLKRKKTEQGIRTFFEVVKSVEGEEGEEIKEDIPTVEDDEEINVEDIPF